MFSLKRLTENIVNRGLKIMGRGSIVRGGEDVEAQSLRLKGRAGFRSQTYNPSDCRACRRYQGSWHFAIVGYAGCRLTPVMR